MREVEVGAVDAFVGAAGARQREGDSSQPRPQQHREPKIADRGCSKRLPAASFDTSPYHLRRGLGPREVWIPLIDDCYTCVLPSASSIDSWSEATAKTAPFLLSPNPVGPTGGTGPIADLSPRRRPLGALSAAIHHRRARIALRKAVSLARRGLPASRCHAEIRSAIGVMEKAAALAPKDAAVRDRLGRILVTEDRFEDAWPHLAYAAAHQRPKAQRLIRDLNAYADAERRDAWALKLGERIRQGDFEGAWSIAGDKSLPADDRAWAAYEIGNAQAAEGNLAAARETFQKAGWRGRDWLFDTVLAYISKGDEDGLEASLALILSGRRESGLNQDEFALASIVAEKMRATKPERAAEIKDYLRTAPRLDRRYRAPR